MLKFLFYHCFFHILTNTKFKHVTSPYYHSLYLVFEFTFDVTYFHRIIGILCMRLYSVYQTLNVLFSVMTLHHYNMILWTCAQLQLTRHN
jgi:hypothetical protein